MLYSFFWVITRLLNFMCRRYGTLCQLHLYRWYSDVVFTPPMEMELTGCFETSAYKIQTPENHPIERIQHSDHGKSLKSRKKKFEKISQNCE
jgi:hypothetical protein